MVEKFQLCCGEVDSPAATLNLRASSVPQLVPVLNRLYASCQFAFTIFLIRLFPTLSARIYYTILVLIIRISLFILALKNALYNYLLCVIIPYLALPARRALRYGTTSQVFPALSVSLQEVLNFQTYLSKIILLRILFKFYPVFTLLFCFNLL